MRYGIIRCSRIIVIRITAFLGRLTMCPVRILHNNHALQRTRPLRSGCNPRVLWAGSLSWGRWAALNVRALDRVKR